MQQRRTTQHYTQLYVYLSLQKICHQAKITGSFSPKILSNNTERYFWINEPTIEGFTKVPSFTYGTLTC